MEKIDDELSKMLSWTFTNKPIKYSLLGLGLLLILLKKLPPNNITTRVIFILFILYFSIHDSQLAIMLVIILLLSFSRNRNNVEHFIGFDGLCNYKSQQNKCDLTLHCKKVCKDSECTEHEGRCAH